MESPIFIKGRKRKVRKNPSEAYFSIGDKVKMFEDEPPLFITDIIGFPDHISYKLKSKDGKIERNNIVERLIWPWKYSEKLNIRRGIANMQHVIKSHNDIDKAMKRPELGWISFIWGREGSINRNFAGGYGVSHIIKKRDHEAKTDDAFKGQKGKDVAIRLPIVIGKGKIVEENYTKKVSIEFAGYKVVLSRDWMGEKKGWLLTGFRISEKRKNPDETVELPSFKQFYAPETYKFTRQQGGAGFDQSQNTNNSDKRENPCGCDSRRLWFDF